MCVAINGKRRSTKWRRRSFCRAIWIHGVMECRSDGVMKSQHASAPTLQHSITPARARFKLTIAYDGANYEGWQLQKVGTGVQEIVETALAKLFPSRPRLHSSSRTDTGVHALGMVAHFEIPRDEFKMTVHRLALAIN